MVRNVKRLPEIAAMNVMLCMLVIFIHVSSAPVTSFDKSSLQFAAVFFPWRFASFVVPGFIFLSGLRMFLNKGGGIDYGKFYISRLTKIVLPYIAWNLIYYLYFIVKGYFPFSLSDLGLYILRGDLVSPFYFIVVIIQFYALAPLWFLIVRKAPVIASLLIAAAVTFVFGRYLPSFITGVFHGASFQYNDRVLTTYLLYWLAGCFVGAQYDKAREWFTDKKLFFFASFAVIGLAEETASYLSFSGIRFIPWLESLHFFYCAAAVFFFFTLFIRFYRDKDMTSRLAKEIDRAAYPIYLVHCLVIFIVGDFMRLAGVTSISAAYAIRIVVVYTVTVTGCILWERVSSKVKRRHALVMK